MASDPERLAEAATESPWDELDQGFFASAPPDNPEPPPEPMRFDDLDPVAQPRAQHSDRVAAWRASVSASARAVRERLAPVRASAAATWRRVTPASVAAARTVARVGRAQTAKVVTLLRRSDARDRQLLLAGLAALLVVMGVSAGVVASRGSGPPAHTVARSTAAAATVACDTSSSAPAFSIAPADERDVTRPLPAEEMLSPAISIAPDGDPLLSPFSVAPDRAAPGPRKRKHSKSVTRPAARANVAATTPASKSVLPTLPTLPTPPTQARPAPARPTFAR